MVQGEKTMPTMKQLSAALCNYTNKNADTYDPIFDAEIRKLAPHWFRSSADVKKELLLNMAKRGEPRPKSKSKLGNALNRYTNINCNHYDPTFDKEIKTIASTWFRDAAARKKLLIEMAKRGEPRPHYSSKMGMCLMSYLRENTTSYDPDFVKEILKYPHWWKKFAFFRKEVLLDMAQKGLPRPKWDTDLGVALNNYFSEKSRSYDPKFKQEIKNVNPNWLESEYLLAIAKRKRELLEMSRANIKRPSSTTKLGQALCRYTTQNSESFDPMFNEEIRKNKEWFMTDDEQKIIFLNMIKRGEKLPPERSPLRCKLYKLMKKYPTFSTEVKNSNWSRDYKLRCHKETLLKMAKSGITRPTSGEYAVRFYNYTNPKGQAYDEDFTNEIQRYWKRERSPRCKIQITQITETIHMQEGILTTTT